MPKTSHPIILLDCILKNSKKWYFKGSLLYQAPCQNLTPSSHSPWQILLYGKNQPSLFLWLSKASVISTPSTPADEGTANKWNANPIQVLVGLFTRAQAKMFKETLNELIQNIWAEVNSWRPKEDAPRVPQSWISMIQAFE